jgi:hypothetical protein
MYRAMTLCLLSVPGCLPGKANQSPKKILISLAAAIPAVQGFLLGKLVGPPPAFQSDRPNPLNFARNVQY